MDHLLSIKSFVTVVRFQSFTKAAEHLKMSTAAVSRAISNLEAHTQTRLLYRSSRHVVLSDSAGDYYAACSDMLERLKDSEQVLIAGRNAKGGLLRVVAHPFAIEAGLLQLLDRFRAGARAINIVVSVENGPVKLERGEYDVAAYPRSLIEDANVICRSLVSSPFVIVAAKGYLSGMCRALTAQDFTSQVLMVCDEQAARQGGLQLCRNNDVVTPVSPASTLIVNESTAIRLALSGYGMALLPRLTVDAHIASGRLQVVLPEYDVVHAPAELDVAFVRRQSLPRRTRDFVDACVNYFGAVNPGEATSA